ncbi:MAG: type II toxin-antitoxin system RelE/ParE family toxin [Pseudomonas sp.]|uniref:type II toxin-antitoxin system RelE/ParE family toxin n=1 Tax=Pseudomonas sp. TaxID=306 RepID=UPI002FC5C143
MKRQESKDIVFLGNSLECLRSFPRDAMREAGHQLQAIQDGEDPDDWKPMKTVGKGVREIRIKDEDGAFRVFYVASLPDAVYVLHAFRKTTEKTEKRDIELAKTRFKSLS